MDSRRVSSKLRAGLCLVWAAVAVGVVPWGEAWADDEILGNKGRGGGLVVTGGAREAEGMGTNGRVDDDILGNPNPPVINTGGGALVAEGGNSARPSSAGEGQAKSPPGGDDYGIGALFRDHIFPNGR